MRNKLLCALSGTFPINKDFLEDFGEVMSRSTASQLLEPGRASLSLRST